MRIFVPTIGTLLRLLTDWEFDLYMEYRNKTLFEHLQFPYADSWREQFNCPTGYDFDPVHGRAHRRVIIPAQSELRVDRIYIRKGAADFDSLTFYWKGAKTKKRTEERTGLTVGPGYRRAFPYTASIPAKPVRFWAKLEDVNRMEAEVVSEQEGTRVP